MRYLRRLRSLGLALLAVSGLATGADRARALSQAITASLLSQPTVTVLPAGNGAPVEGYGAGGASLSFGQAAFSGGHPAPGVVERKSGSSMILSTRFDLKVACNAGARSSWAEVSISLATVDASWSISMDGVRLSSAPFVTELPCSSVTEHRLDVELSDTAPAGPFDTAVSFSARNSR